MAGAAPAPAARGGRRPLDATLNLVPFIDLLSCCISFLLITAVWVQLARIDVAQKAPGTRSDDREDAPAVRLVLYVNRDGYVLRASTGEDRAVPLRDGDYDYGRLGEVMEGAKRAHPEVSAITLKVADGVLYQRIIRTMDQVIAVGGDPNRPLFPAVSVTDQGG